MENTYANLTQLEQSIVSELEKIQIIDCHEHLPAEADRLASGVDALTLFSHYCRDDLQVAGLTREQVDFCFRTEEPLELRWAIFKPFYEQIRFTSYARAAQIAMNKFYGCAFLTDQTVDLVSARIKAANQAGLYARVLRDACNIRTALTQNVPLDLKTDSLLTKVIGLPEKPAAWKIITSRRWSGDSGNIENFEQLEDAVRAFVNNVKAKGGVGIKKFIMPFTSHSRDDSRDAAREVFNLLKSNQQLVIDEDNPLTEHLFDIAADQAASDNLVFCLHTGYWGDFRKLDPAHIIPFVTRHKDTRFDVYHAGYPYVRQAIMLGKAMPNIWLNMCWTYIISQKFAEDALDEMLEMVPVNKLLGFGGDYTVVEKVYGHLIMARESIARVLAQKITRGHLSFDQAIRIARRILQTNAEELYRL